MLLPEGSATIIALYIRLYYEFWVNKWWYFNSLRPTVMILIFLMWTVSSLNSEFIYIFSISILTQLQDCLAFFLQSLLFKKNAHWEGIEGTNHRVGRWFWKMGLRVIISQRVKVRIFAFTSTMDHHMTCKCDLRSGCCCGIFVKR